MSLVRELEELISRSQSDAELDAALSAERAQVIAWLSQQVATALAKLSDIDGRRRGVHGGSGLGGSGLDPLGDSQHQLARHFGSHNGRPLS